MNENDVLLSIEGLAVTAGTRTLIEGLSLSLRSGQATGILGASGCGKTTLLRTLAGLETPTRGALLFRGQPRDAKGWPRYRRSVILVGQQPILFDTTVKENLQRPFAYRVDGLPFPEKEADAILTSLGMDGECLPQSAHALSVGQQMRVCIARALLLRPAVLLLDEPTAALDRGTAAVLNEVLKEAMSMRSLAILAASHDESFLQDLADPIVSLDGKSQP